MREIARTIVSAAWAPRSSIRDLGVIRFASNWQSEHMKESQRSFWKEWWPAENLTLLLKEHVWTYIFYGLGLIFVSSMIYDKNSSLFHGVVCLLLTIVVQQSVLSPSTGPRWSCMKSVERSSGIKFEDDRLRFVEDTILSVLWMDAFVLTVLWASRKIRRERN